MSDDEKSCKSISYATTDDVRHIRGDATGTAGTAIAVPNLNQTSSGLERFF